MFTFLSDLRYGIRQLKKPPGFTVVCRHRREHSGVQRDDAHGWVGSLRRQSSECALLHHIGWQDPEDDLVIVGVVKNHKYRSIEEAPIPMMWSAYTQPKQIGEMHVEMRVQGDPMAILPAVRKVMQQIDPNLPLMEAMTQRDQYEEGISRQLLFARLAEFFGLLAVILVATGLYGTLAYHVNNRTVEIGVRMPVGAKRTQVIWMVLRDSLLMTSVGIIIGVPLAFVCRQGVDICPLRGEIV